MGATKIGRVVLCGGIGSGKSTVGRMLADRGALVIDGDAVGHLVLSDDPTVRARVATRWPGVLVDGEIDRTGLARIVFADPAELAALEAITHPAIRDRILDMATAARGLVIVELPVLGKVLGPEWYRVVVDAPAEVRRRRLVERGMAPDDAERRIASQPSREQWLAQADEVVDNSGDVLGLEEQVEALWARLGGRPRSDVSPRIDNL